MTGASGSAQEAEAATYNTAADHFDHPALGFWDRYGRGTVERLALQPGASVLDVCCGSGASALPAAAAVGPSGSVLGIDVAEGLLGLARDKARAAGLDNVEFRVGDMMDMGLPAASFDAVVCVFGVFFVPDVTAAVEQLWRVVRPGGQLAVTIWGPRIFEPATSAFWAAVARERPELVHAYEPWNRITDPDGLRECLVAAGVAGATIEEEDGWQPLQDPDDWWTIVLGTGYRATADQLAPDAAARVRRACSARLAGDRVTAVETNG